MNYVRLIELLRPIARPGTSPELIENWALEINACFLDLRVRDDGGTRKIGVDRRRGAFAIKHTPPSSALRQLDRLLAAAERGMWLQWIKAYAATGHEARRLVDKETPARLAFARSFNAPGYEIVMPSPADALPYIRVALDRLRNAKRGAGRRAGCALEQAAVDAIAWSYEVLSGTPIGYTKDPITGEVLGPLPALVRAIETHYSRQLMGSQSVARLRAARERKKHIPWHLSAT